MTWDDFIGQVEALAGRKLSVTSWYRSAAHNNAVGGVKTSRHLTGQAIDVVWDGVSPPLEETLQPLLLRGRVKLVREKDHDHFEFGPNVEQLNIGA